MRLRPRIGSPEVGLDHLRVLLDLVGRARGDRHAVVEHGDALADVHHQPHVVLDEQDRQRELVAQPADQRRAARASPAGSSRRPARRAAAPWARSPARARSRAAAGRRRAGCAPARRARSSSPKSASSRRDALDDRRLLGLLAAAARRIVGTSACSPRRWQATRTLSSTESSPNRRMFWNVRAIPACGDLVRPQPDRASRPVEPDRPGVGPVDAGQQVEDGRLARAVRADQAVQRRPAAARGRSPARPSGRRRRSPTPLDVEQRAHVAPPRASAA